MAKTKYHIILTEDQKSFLNKIIEENKESDRTIMRAKIMLESDEITGSHLSLVKLAAKLGTTDTTIQTTRTEYAQKGLEESVFRKERVVSKETRKLNNEVIRRIIELTTTAPPEGKKRWSNQTLCNACIEQGIVSHISTTSIHRLLKEYGITLK